MEEQNIKDLLTVLYSDVKKYLDIKFDYYRLDLIEKIILFASKGFVLVLFLIIVPIITIFLSFGGAYYLGELLGSVYLGFFAVAGILMIFAILFLIFKKPIFLRPLIRTLIDTFFNNDQINKKDGKNKL
jgi:hypothetical protein